MKTKKHLKAAETFESIQQLDLNNRYETSICYHYANAGRKKLSDDWAEIAYNNNPSGVNAYNLALIKNEDTVEYKNLMEKAITLGCDAAWLVYGKHLLNSDEKRGRELIQKAFRLWHHRFKSNVLDKNDYSRLIEAATLLDKNEIAGEVQEAKNRLTDNANIVWFNPENTVTDERLQLENNNINRLN